MTMNRRLIRRIAFVLLALLGFAQASFAFAGCVMDRGDMAAMATTGDCCGEAPQFEALAELRNDCLAHCTADLQLAGAAVALVQVPAEVVVYLLPPGTVRYPAAPAPPPAIPSRVLLHSYLI
jgi:hypothetical protein